MNLEDLSDEQLLELRDKTKIEISNADVFQQNIKILLNSLYGSMANKYSRFFNLRNAEAITLTGQLAVSWIEIKFNQYFSKIFKEDKDYVVAIDTDSCMVDLTKFVELIKEKKPGFTEEALVDYLSTYSDVTIGNLLDVWYRELKEVMGFYDHKLHMKRECIASSGFFTAKKRYVLKVHDKEGIRYSEPKLKIMGLESERSSTPSYFKDKLKESFKIILSEDNDSLIRYVNEVRMGMKDRPPEDIAFSRGVNGVEKYYIPNKPLTQSYRGGTPIHVRASIVFNYLVSSKNLQNKYEHIKSGDKIKYIYLKSPNPLGENILAFRETIPPEFGIDKYLDYNQQFKKAFETPLQNVLDCFGWTTKKTRRLI